MSETQGQNQPVLTNRQGHPVYDNQDQRTIGNRGPATLENYHFLDKITHFDRERVPERVVHARGFVAHGYFEAYGTIGDEPASTYTRAKLCQEKGKRTPVSVRFSTVIGGRDSSESARDPRGFAVKFRTEDGNWDLVGNNLPVFFTRDAIKFPDVVHAFKPDPVTFRQDPNRIFDFCTLQPSSLHLLTMLMTTRGIPRNYWKMHGFGVNAYRMVNAKGEGVLVKYHWLCQQGVEGMTAAEAAEQQGRDLGHASSDLYEAIERGEFPKWELCVQIMSDGEHHELDFDPLDATKTWPHGQFPLRRVGMMTLDTNVKNHFLESEQIAFGAGVLVDGLDFSDDKLLVGRTFAYSDTQRYRIGANYLQLPVNRSAVPVRTNLRDGNMAYSSDGDEFNPHVNYEPSQMGGAAEAREPYPQYEPMISGRLVRAPINRRDDWRQPGVLYTKLTQPDREDLIRNLGNELRQCDRTIQERATAHFARCHPEFGQGVASAIGLSVQSLDVQALTTPPGERRVVEPVSGSPAARV